MRPAQMRFLEMLIVSDWMHGASIVDAITCAFMVLFSYEGLDLNGAQNSSAPDKKDRAAAY